MRADDSGNAGIVDRAVHDVVLRQENRKRHAFFAVDLAHVVMLGEKAIIPQSHAAALVTALRDIYRRDPIEDAADTALSFFYVVEAALQSRVGREIAGQLQLGRSRLDQSAAIRRLHCRDALLDIMRNLSKLQESTLARAADWVAVLMPGWTHLQQSQPWNAGHYMLAQNQWMARDMERLRQCYARVNRSALGAAAMVGTSWPVDRRRVCDLLGHDDVVDNAMDAAASQSDYAAEIVAALSILLMGLSRLASDLYLWSSAEFGFIKLADRHCGTSTIMPQKRNPLALARLRAIAGEAIGWLPSQLGILKSPSSSDCDSFYAGGGLEDNLETARQAVALMNDVLEGVEISSARCTRALAGSWCTVSALANMLVDEAGLDFRSAHDVVGAMVADMMRRGLTPAEMAPQHLDEAAMRVLGRPMGIDAKALARELDARRFASTHISEGGMAPPAIAQQLASSRQQWHQAHFTLDTLLARRDEAHERLHAAASAMAEHTGPSDRGQA